MMSKAPLVSVVIPAYNQERFLPAALESVLAQAYQDYEIIVVDDGSTDGTAHIAQSFGRRVRYLYQTNQGLAAARNAGIRAAQGELIALLDADDTWQPAYLAKMVAHLAQYPDAAGVYCGYQYTNAEGQPVGRPRCKVVPPADCFRVLICEGNWLSACAVILRRQLVEAAGLFDVTMRWTEDADLWVRLSQHHPLVGLPEVLVTYRQHGNNSSANTHQAVQGNYRVTEKMFGPPEGDPKTWDGLKRLAYARTFRFGTMRYLAAQNPAESARYYRQLLIVAPEQALNAGFWRSLAFMHLPVQYRESPEYMQISRAEGDIDGLVSALALEAEGLATIRAYYGRIAGTADLALARSAIAHGEIRKTLNRLLASCRHYPGLLLTRTWWGGLVYLILGVVWRQSSEQGRLAPTSEIEA